MEKEIIKNTIEELSVSINSLNKRKRNKWIYIKSCVGCSHYINFAIKHEQQIVITKFCNETFKHINNPEISCLYCDYNKANPTKLWILKYNLKQFIQNIKNLFNTLKNKLWIRK